MKKRILSLFLALAFLCGLLPQMGLTAHADTYSGNCGAEGDGSNLQWSFDDATGKLSITGSGKMQDFSFSNTPWFNYHEAITAVSLPKGLTSIGHMAFSECIALTGVTIPSGVTSIGEFSFAECISLKSLTLPKNVTSIGEGAFAFTGLTSVTVPSKVKVIEGGVFAGCEQLGAIAVASDNPNFCSVNGVLYNKAKTVLVQYPAGKKGTSYQIPSGVTDIADIAFYGSKKLKKVTIPDSVTSIGDFAFYDCAALKCVTIPAGVKKIGELAFGFSEGKHADDFIITGYTGTVAEEYANEYAFEFVSLGEAIGGFIDVKSDDWFKNPVLWAVGNGVTSGRDATHFAPQETVMRSEAMMFLWAAKGKPSYSTKKSPFKDVKKKDWFYGAVLWAVENKITSGTDATHFSPSQTCGRSEILQFLYAMMGKPGYTIKNPYKDVKKKHWYYDGAIWAYEKGLEKGESGKFNAATPCTRAYVVTYLYRFITGEELAQ